MVERGQESLIVVADQTGQVALRDLEQQGIAVSLIERDIRLQNVITYMAQVSMLNGFLSSDAPAERSYGDNAEQARESARQHIRELMGRANDEFDHASGSLVMLQAGVPKNQVKRYRTEAFSDFHKKYSGHRHYAAAQTYRRQLAGNVTMLQAEPHLQQAPARETPGPRTENNPDLSIFQLKKGERVWVVRDDTRANFLPATAQETTRALTFLDYLDNPEYQWGINNQLHEVFIHQQKPKDAGVNEGRQAVESIVYELTDYLSNAFICHTVLSEFQALLSDCPNPKATLDEDIGPNHPAYAILQRFADLSAIDENGKVTGLKRDPLRTREYRWAEEGPGKHKVIEDQYTASEPKPIFAKRIAAFPKTTTVGEARKLLPYALQNEENRARFFTERLKETKTIPGRRIFASVLNFVGSTLDHQQLRVS